LDHLGLNGIGNQWRVYNWWVLASFPGSLYARMTALQVFEKLDEAWE